MINGLLVAAARETVLGNVRCVERAGLTCLSVDLTSFAVLRSMGRQTGLDIKTEALLDATREGLVFVNLVDFDSLYGHRNDPEGYARALEELDQALPRIIGKLQPGDVLAITADHGCDPTTPSTDHSREYVPLLAHVPGRGGGALGVRDSFADVGATVAEWLGVTAPAGRSVAGALRP